MSVNFNFVKFLFGLFLLISLPLFLSSCNKEDNTEESCSNFKRINGSVIINGVPLALSEAQMDIEKFDGPVQYTFKISGFTTDCNELLSLKLYIMDVGNILEGTFPIKDVFTAGYYDAQGIFISQKISPTTHSIEDLVSGNVIITSSGNKWHTIDLNAMTKSYENVQLLITHKF